MTIRDALKVYEKVSRAYSILDEESKALDGFRAAGDWRYIAEHAEKAAKAAKSLEKIAADYFAGWYDSQAAMMTWFDRGEDAFAMQVYVAKTPGADECFRIDHEEDAGEEC